MGNKKRVTFADLMGFSLVSVIEIAPRNKLEELAEHPLQNQRLKASSRRRYLSCLFEQPAEKEDFPDRVKSQYVCLESMVCDNTIVRGFVRVLNVAYTKHVSIRYSTDNWNTICNEHANYLCTSIDGTMDTFFFRILLPSIWHERSKMEFAICYSVEGCDYWDNNFHRNYSVSYSTLEG